LIDRLKSIRGMPIDKLQDVRLGGKETRKVSAVERAGD
jgi:hypothetical protein